MTTVLFASNPVRPDDWTRIETDDPAEAIRAHFQTAHLPPTVRVFDLEGINDQIRGALNAAAGQLAGRDITPVNETGIARLRAARGPLVVVAAPASAGLIIGAILAVVAITVGMFMLMPKIPKGNNQFESPNNSLSERSNRPRVLKRIPDIFGTVRSIPDLLTVPYRTFRDHEEVETSMMCVGRGAYEIADVRDGDTPIVEVSGSSVTIWGPNTGPNSGDPQEVIGTPIDEAVYSVTRMNEVNGQLLRPPNSNQVTGDSNIIFVAPDEIQTTGGIDFTEYFAADDEITVGKGAFSTGGYLDNMAANVYFTDDFKVWFDGFSPDALFDIGDVILITNAGYSYPSGSVNVTADLSGTYVVDAFDGYSMTVSGYYPTSGDLSENDGTGDTPSPLPAPSGDWTVITGFPDSQTPVKIVSFSLPLAGGSVDFAGTYTALSVEAGRIVLSNPVLVNADWDTLVDQTPPASVTLSTSAERWVGPFICDMPDLSRVVSNFVAPQGLYLINKKGNQIKTTVDVRLEVTPIDSNDDPSGPATVFDATVIGTHNSKALRAISVEEDIATGLGGRVKIRAKRLTATRLDWQGTVVDEIRWRDCYGMAPYSGDHFGDVTTVQARTYATAGASAIKERKLNMQVTRMIPVIDTGTLTTDLFASDRIDDIICAVATDPYIGRMAESDIDIAGIEAAVDAVEAHFASDHAVRFGYSFDDDQTSVEDTMALIANAGFCEAYRAGSVLRIRADIPQDSSVMLFNHRNTVPGSMKRTITFGMNEQNDGVEVTYEDEDSGSPASFQIPPATRSDAPTAPRKIELRGVRFRDQAWWHGRRLYNRMRFQRTAIEFEAMEEARILARLDRIMVEDQARSGEHAGDVVGYDTSGALPVVTLSEPLIGLIDGVQTAYFTLESGEVEAVEIARKLDDYTIELASTPALPLIDSAEAVARTTYIIVGGSDQRRRLFQMTGRKASGTFTEGVDAINYDARYYQDDGWPPD